MVNLVELTRLVLEYLLESKVSLVGPSRCHSYESLRKRAMKGLKEFGILLGDAGRVDDPFVYPIHKRMVDTWMLLTPCL